MSAKYAELAKEFMSSGNKGSHVDDLAEKIIQNHPHVKDSSEVISQKLSQYFSSSTKRKNGEFLRVKNSKGGNRRGFYKLKREVLQTKEIPKAENVSTQFIGKAGEHAVLSELLFQGYNASIMTVDDGIDVVASKNNKYFHIQVKSANEREASFFFKIPKSSFERHNKGETFYILVCRRDSKIKIQNDFIILPSATIHHYVTNNIIKDNKDFSLRVSIENKNFILNNEGNLNSYMNNFTILK